jgi:hypothetical protein
VPADSAYPEVAVAEDDAVVCSMVAPAAGGEELAWCEIRRGGGASSATIRNLRYDPWLILVWRCPSCGVRIVGKVRVLVWFNGPILVRTVVAFLFW